MISENEKKALLKRIESSNSFGSTATYTRLLKFLVESTQQGSIPKEYTVAAHLFGKNEAGSDTSKVRVYVYHLRKKLQLFFENEGKEETYILSIPKGGYKVQFKKNKADTLLSALSSKAKYTLWGILGLLLCSFLANTFFIFKTDQNPQHIVTMSPIWEDFFNDDKPTLIVIGDLFIFSEEDPQTGGLISIRNPRINSRTAFEIYRNTEENAGRILNEMTYTHLVKSSNEWILTLSKIFHPKKDFNIRVRTRVEAKDLHDYNIIFVGMQKTAGIFNSYFDSSAFDYDVSRTDEYRHKTQEGILKSYSPKGDPDNKHTDYGFIAKYPGPNNNTIFMFSGLWDSATSESLRNFAVAGKLTKIEKQMQAQMGYIPKYFEMLIEVNGVDRIGFEAKVLHLNDITKK